MGERMRGLLKRRGLLAGAAALVAGGLAKVGGPGRADASHLATGSDFADRKAVHVGADNPIPANAGVGLGGNANFELFSVSNGSGGNAAVVINGHGTAFALGVRGVSGSALTSIRRAVGVHGVSVTPGAPAETPPAHPPSGRPPRR